MWTCQFQVQLEEDGGGSTRQRWMVASGLFYTGSERQRRTQISRY